MSFVSEWRSAAASAAALAPPRNFLVRKTRGQKIETVSDQSNVLFIFNVAILGLFLLLWEDQASLHLKIKSTEILVV